MTLQPLQKGRMLEIMKKLEERSTSRVFSQAVDPVCDNCPDYLSIVSCPMDLGTVKTKLMNNQYNSVTEWKADVNLIWSNSLLYNTKSPLMRLITRDLSSQFQSLSATLSDSLTNDWIDELQALGNEMSQVMKEMPMPQEAAPAKKQKERKASLPSKKERKPNSKTNENWKPKPPVVESTAKVPPKKNRSFSREELLELTKQINAIVDENKLTMITKVLKKCGVAMDEDKEVIEVNLKTLTNSTISALWQAVNELT